MRADGETRLAVVGEHPLPLGLLAESGSLGRRIERQRELARFAGRPGNALGARHEAELPEQHAAIAEQIACAGCDQGLETVAGKLGALSELDDRPEAPAPLALLDEWLRLVLADL